VNLVVEGRPCLVVGGGRVAARKAEGLLTCGARVHLVAEQVGHAVRALSGVTWEERPYERGEVAGYRLAMAATDSDEVNDAVFRDGEQAGVWVNSADDPAHCSFTLPSVVRRGDLVVTIGTGGRSPALAAYLKDRLATEVGPEWEVLLELLAEERERLQAAGTSTETVDWRRALDSGMLDLVRTGRVAQAKELLRACLSSSSD
jgi:siroheme synthase-like protein